MNEAVLPRQRVYGIDRASPREYTAHLPDRREILNEIHISIDPGTQERLSRAMAEFQLHIVRSFLGIGLLTVNELRADMGLLPIEETAFPWQAGSAIAREGAAARGEALLREWLSPVQLESYQANGWFEVTGGDTGRRYRIRPGDTFNVEELDAEGGIACRLCFAPRGWLVSGDVMLAQKIALESNETATLKIANRRFDGSFFLRVDGTDWDWDVPAIQWARANASGGTVRSDPPSIWIGGYAGETVHPRSWMAGWGRMGADLARRHRRDRTRAGSISPAARQAHR